MTLFIDTFAGSAGSTIAGRTASGGLAWAKLGSGNTDTPVLDGLGGLKTGGVDPTDPAMFGFNHGDADHFVQSNWSPNAIQSNGSDAGSAPYICVRVTDRTSYVGATYDDASGIWRIYQRGGFGNLVASSAMAAPTVETIARLVAQSLTFSLYVDDMDTPVATTTLGTGQAFETATACGIYLPTTAAENPILTGPYYSGLLTDIGSIPGGGGGGSGGRLIGGKLLKGNLIGGRLVA